MTLHPQSQAFLDAAKEADLPDWSEMPLDQARETFESLPLFGDAPEIEDVTDIHIAGVPVRMYKPKVSRAHDAIVYFHGGGWVLGSIDSHDAFCRRLAVAADAAVVSVEYRQPPEDPFPAAVEDCFTVCDVLAMDHGSFGLSDRMVVAGDSAGGNLSLAVALMARERGAPRLVGQTLIYPVTDGTMSGASYASFGDGFGLTREMMSWFWQMYTGDADSPSRSHPLASPLQADLAGLPPTHVLTAEYDVLKSEGDALIQRLVEAEVPTTTQHCAGMLHGFIHFAEAFDDAVTATNEIARRCREMLDA